ncbi:F510_1955 family glycosylhydrolase [Pseudalkalibacillus sp. A8]|uniref:F510_1955 family glycosylhydrolase n=1 Tax=Pseudalkalibacillus sp. A8 TaxID=3382641 RepID=UPI0038B4302B
MKLIYKSPVFVFLLSLIPANVFAHGTEQQHEKEMLLNELIQYTMIISVIFIVLFSALMSFTKNKISQTPVKTKDGRELRKRLTQKNKFYMWFVIISSLILIISLALKGFTNSSGEETSVSFPDIHGIGYSNNGEIIYVPAHDGIKAFENGRWSIPDLEKHDFMGFSKVDDGFYSSGHPAPGSDKKNPLGIVKYTNSNQTLEPLDLYGEIDFHGLAVGFESHAIYAFNPKPNSKMDEVGLYYSTDNAKSWNKSDMKGLDGNPTSMAVHPSKEYVVAIGTPTGLYLSTDSGMTFKEVVEDIQVTAITFSIEGNLLVGGAGIDELQDQGIMLVTYDLESDEQKTLFNPVEKEDSIMYLAQAPTDPRTIALATGNKDIYVTQDRGESWNKIADKGESKTLE